MKATILVSVVAALSACTAAARFDPEQCGPTGGHQICKNNQCCSQHGWCGTTDAYCQVKRGCNRAFGRCIGSVTSSAVRSSSIRKPTSTVRSSSTKHTSVTVRPSSTTRSSSFSRTSASPAPASNKNERCGPSNGGKSCKGSIYGSCCSSHGWCGSTNDHCKTGCQSAFGTCAGSARSSSAKSSARASSSVRSSTRTLIHSTSSTSSRSSGATTVHSSAGSTGAAASSSSVQNPSGSGSSTRAASSSVTSSTSATPSALSLSASTASTASSVGSLTTVSVSGASSLSSTTPSASTSPYTWVPAQNPNVDRASSDRLVPAHVLSLYYVEPSPGTHVKTEVVTLAGDSQGVVLDDIAAVESVSCSGSTISINFADDATAAAAAQSWPAGTLLFTSASGCSTANERGVYSVQSLPPNKRSISGRQSTLYRLLQLIVQRMSLSDIIAALQEFIQQLEPRTSSVPPVVTPTPSMIPPTNNSASVPPEVTLAPSTIIPPTNTSASTTESMSSSIAEPTPSGPSFCLKVLTQGQPSSNWVVKQSSPSNNNGAFWLDPVEGGLYSSISSFTIDAQNVMHVTTPGTVGDTITRYSRGTGGMFRWATPYEPLPSNTCEIRTDVLGFLGQQVLKCTGSLKSPSQTFTGFADKDVNGNGLHYLFGVQVSNGTALYGEQLLELGLFNGGGCPV